MVFNRQSTIGELGHKNTIYIICDNCNRKEDKIQEIFYSEPHGNFMGLLGRIFHEFCPLHCEILCSYLQQPNQHRVYKTHFHAEPHSQAEENTLEGIFCSISRSKLTDSVLSDNSSLPYSAR